MWLFLRAVRTSGSRGRPGMLRVRLDGLDDQVECVGAVDLAGYAVIAVRRDLLGFGEVVEPIHPVRGVISHDKHDARAVFRPRDQSEMIGAEDCVTMNKIRRDKASIIDSDVFTKDGTSVALSK